MLIIEHHEKSSTSVAETQEEASGGDSKRTSRPESPGTIISRNTMKDKLEGLGGLTLGIAAAASAFAGFAPWITALFALAAGIECLRLGLFGGGRHDD